LFLLAGYGAPTAGPADALTLAAYDPATDAWSTIEHPLVGVPWMQWTGREVLFTGMLSASYDPATGDWRALASPADLGGFGTVWTGSSLVRVHPGGESSIYDPRTDRWRGGANGAGVLEDAAVVAAGPAALWWGGVVGRGGSKETTNEGWVVMTSPDTGVPTTPPTLALPPKPPAGGGARTPIAGPDGGSPGFIVEGDPPVVWQGQVTPFLAVYDEAGAVVGFFGAGCGGFVALAEFAAPGFDPFARCDAQRAAIRTIEVGPDGVPVVRDGSGRVVNEDPPVPVPTAPS
jgi:hypothetical protein